MQDSRESPWGSDGSGIFCNSHTAWRSIYLPTSTNYLGWTRERFSRCCEYTRTTLLRTRKRFGRSMVIKNVRTHIILQCIIMRVILSQRSPCWQTNDSILADARRNISCFDRRTAVGTNYDRLQQNAFNFQSHERNKRSDFNSVEYLEKTIFIS